MRKLHMNVGKRAGERGTTMVLVAMLVASLAMLSFALVSIVGSTSRAVKGSKDDLNAIYVCESGIGQAVFELANGGDGNVGSEDVPIKYGNASYWITANDLGSNMTSLTATGRDNKAVSRVEVIVRPTQVQLYKWAAFGDEGMEMASNAFVDSYDSSLGTYADQAVNGSGADTYALQNGNVGSNLDVTLKQNANVNGDAVPGPTGTATILGSATVSGSTTPAPNESDMPPLEVPDLPSLGDLTVSSDTTLASGTYHYDHLSVSASKTLKVFGPATLVFDYMELRSNANLIVDATDGPVEVYVRKDFILNSNTLVASTRYDPSDVSIYLESDNVIDPNVDVDLNPDIVSLDSNAQLYGTLYAPNARIEINSNFELFGSLVARSTLLDSNARLHFDEALLDVIIETNDGSYETVCWRILPDVER